MTTNATRTTNTRPSIHDNNVVNLVAGSTAVEKCVVSDGTRAGYYNKIVEFIIWLLKNNHHEILSDQCTTLPNLIALDERNRSKTYPRTRNHIKNIISSIERDVPSSSPIRIIPTDTNPTVLSYPVILGFFSDKYKIVETDRASAIAFQKKLAELTRGDTEADVEEALQQLPHGDENGMINVAIRLESSCYEGHRSAIAYLYTVCGSIMPQELSVSLSRYIKGSNRINLAAKQTLGLSFQEGKSEMTIPVYEYVCKELFRSEDPKHILTHVFTVLDWNLMKRAENAVEAKISHISFRDDALVFQFAKSKGRQNGEEHLGPWHIFANPHKPYLCPVLAMARYLFMYPESLLGTRKVFEGSNTYSRYCKQYRSFLLKHADEIRNLGQDANDLGSHSARKGVGSLVASGCTISPPIVAICLRMGWALGGVLGKYLKHGEAGDQHVGRTASLMNPCVKEFGVSCPYFDFSDIDDVVKKEELKHNLKVWLDERLPSGLSEQSRNVALHLFASVCYHSKYLDENLHPRSAFRQAVLMKDIPEDFKKQARIAYPWNTTPDTPKLTGIPPHVFLLAANEEMKQEIRALKESVAQTVADELSRRGVGCTEFYTKDLEERLIAKLESVERNLVQNNNSLIQRARADNQLEAQEVDEILNQLNADYDFQDEMDINDNHDDERHNNEGQSINNESAELRLMRSQTELATLRAQLKQRKVFRVGYVKGKMTILPNNFAFPKALTCSNLVHNWFIGNSQECIVPYRRINAAELHHVPGGAVVRQRMGRFMSVVEFYAKRDGVWPERGSNITVASVNHLWATVSTKYILPLYGNQRASRQDSVSWTTVLNLMQKKGAFKKKRDDCVNDEEWRRSIYYND